MTFKELHKLLGELDKLKAKGGKTYQKIEFYLNQEATTHNINELLEVSKRIKDALL